MGTQPSGHSNHNARLPWYLVELSGRITPRHISDILNLGLIQAAVNNNRLASMQPTPSPCRIMLDAQLLSPISHVLRIQVHDHLIDEALESSHSHKDLPVFLVLPARETEADVSPKIGSAIVTDPRNSFAPQGGKSRFNRPWTLSTSPDRQPRSSAHCQTHNVPTWLCFISARKVVDRSSIFIVKKKKNKRSRIPSYSTRPSRSVLIAPESMLISRMKQSVLAGGIGRNKPFSRGDRPPPGPVAECIAIKWPQSESDPVWYFAFVAIHPTEYAVSRESVGQSVGWSFCCIRTKKDESLAAGINWRSDRVA